ncbi:MAG: PSD1 and planctomycete cytochrome C domain-containing protein [Aureliella sp.]
MDIAFTSVRVRPAHVRQVAAWFSACAVALLPLVASGQNAKQTSADAHFETHIRPVLVSKCLSCHGPDKQESGLRVDTLQALLEGGDSGAAVEAGDLDASLLIEAIRYEGFEMPPSGKLDDETIGHFETWVESGAKWPEHETLRKQSGVFTQADRNLWAFRPIDRSSPPSVDLPPELGDWSHNPVDQFVYQHMNSKGITPAPRADETTLLRRLYLGLTGIAPTPSQVDAYNRNPSPDRWPELVDQLLASEAYGEHWARHWLDLVRYSESDGWNQDAHRPHIWRYRDWVVEAFNSDMPYPEFVRHQLAGDEVAGDDPNPLAAAGYLRLGIYEYNQRDARGHWNDIMNEITDVTGDVFLGLSMSCARCHDHKFDPIAQKDYFALRAFFEGISWRDDVVAATDAEKAAYEVEHAKWLEATAEIRSKIEQIEKPYIEKKWASTVDKFPVDIQACFHMPIGDRTSWQNQMAYLVSRQFLEEGGGPFKSLKKEDKAARDKLLDELKQFDSIKPRPLPQLMTATDFDGITSPTVIPDDADRKPIEPGYLTVLNHLPSLPTQIDTEDESIRKRTSGRRTALAKWIGDPENPLTTRLIVNRVWQQHFGEGLVATSSDFGTQGSPPSHPGLLDWLTANYVDGGWKMKQLHRMILNSETWKLATDHPKASEFTQLDPNEQLLWRWRVRRLTAEQIRDSMLLASGELEAKVGGPSVAESQPGRSLYLKSFRNKNDTFLHGFDIANGLRSVAVRDSTTTPTQSLLLINGSYALDRARALAKRLEKEHSLDTAKMIRAAYRCIWGRAPTTEQHRRALEFLDVHQGEDQQAVNHDKLVDFCHVLFNANQFLYVE